MTHLDPLTILAGGALATVLVGFLVRWLVIGFVNDLWPHPLRDEREDEGGRTR